MNEPEPISDQELAELYGVCTVCGAPRDWVECTYDNGTVEVKTVCTATYMSAPREPGGLWGHEQGPLEYPPS